MLSEKRKKEMLFPHEEVRTFQEDLLQDIANTIKNQAKLIAHAPTGLGKTSSVLGPALEQALRNNLTVWFLTNRHTQHNLAIETLKLIQKKFGLQFSCVDLLGKRWMCGQAVKDLFSQEFNEFCKSLTEKGECEFLSRVKTDNTITVEAQLLLEKLQKGKVLHNEEVIDLCNQQGFCSYEISLELGKKAQVIIGDYYYLFNPHIRQRILGKLNKKLEKTILIVDEAHNLPGRVIEMLSYSLTDHVIKNAILEARKFGFDYLIEDLEKIVSILKELNFYSDHTKEKKISKKEFTQKIDNYPDLINGLELAADEIRKKRKKSFMGGVSTFLDAWLGKDAGFTRIIAEKENKFGKFIDLSYSCLDPSLITKKVFEQVHSAVLMSGTLKPTFMYNDILGFDGKEKEYPSPFPLENKLNLIVPETTTKFNLRGNRMYSLIAQKCSEIMDLIPGNCAIFFPSYKLMEEIGFKIENKKKKFWERPKMSKEEKEQFLEDFKNEKDSGGLLLGVMGGSFGEGIDLPGDLLQGVIIVGIPLSRPDLKTKEVINYFEEKFGKGWDYGYLYPAMNLCFQSAGRCIRSEKDKGAMIFLDQRFSWQNYFRCFPTEGLIVSKDYQKLLKEFF